MSIPVSTLLNRLQTELLDPDEVYWTSSELIDYINASQKAVINLKPDCYTQTVPLTLQIGQALQSIPSDGYQFLELAGNKYPTLRAITPVEKNTLDHHDPYWQTVKGTAVQHYMNDPRNPKVFYVYPVPSISNQQVELVYSVEPPAVSSASDTIDLDSVYENPLFFYAWAMALSKNTKRQDLGKANMYFGMFRTLLGDKANAQLMNTPKVPDKTPPSNQ